MRQKNFTMSSLVKKICNCSAPDQLHAVNACNWLIVTKIYRVQEPGTISFRLLLVSEIFKMLFFQHTFMRKNNILISSDQGGLLC